ncbi:MAG: hypothetical protein OXQ93_03145 [Gemmatimonadota bacterium]|nr:hypothetical protein [Gemmatimonadota bacterium]
MTKQVLMSTGSLPFRTITASVRTSVLTGLALAAALFLPAVIQGQAPPDIPPPSDTLYEVSLADGSVIIARIAEVDEERVVLTTPGGGRVEIGRDQIRGIRPVRGRVVEGELWHEDPSTTRLLFTATGRSLGKGEAYVGTYVIALPFAAVGITDRVSIAAGAPVLFGELEPFYVGPRVQIVRTPKAQATLGTLVFFFDDEAVGIAYGVATLGDTDKALSAGLGFFYSGDDVESEPAFMLGGETRVSRRIKLMTENYLLPDAVGLVLSGGIRVIGERFATEIGVITVVAEDDAFCCIPLINFSYAFGRN